MTSSPRSAYAKVGFHAKVTTVTIFSITQRLRRRDFWVKDANNVGVGTGDVVAGCVNRLRRLTHRNYYQTE